MPRRVSPRITVVLADDSLIVREGVRALLSVQSDLEIVGVAGDYDELLDVAGRTEAHVVVADIRMPPSFTTEGIDAAKEIRKRYPGTGVVVLSQFDDPEYAIELLAEGADGYAYLLKDRVAEGDQLVRAVREVAIGGSMLDPAIADALVRPVSSGLSPADEELLRLVAAGRSVKSIAASRRTTPATISSSIAKMFVTLGQDAGGGARGALRHLQALHHAIVEREERGESLVRFLPAGVAEKLRREDRRIGESEMLDVTVLMSDVRGFTTIAERADPASLCAQLSEHRAAMSRAVHAQDGTVMAFIGDAVMGVFGAPVTQVDHAERALAAARAMQSAQADVNRRWTRRGLPPFPIGIGLSTGEVAAALLGSEERLEYTVIGDTVNLAQRLQQWAAEGEIVMSEPTYSALPSRPDAEQLPPAAVKGRSAPVGAWKLPSQR
ncbi:MAG: adenylate/guanylate cyclase domain-containing protein [Actinomycetota bacterium]